MVHQAGLGQSNFFVVLLVSYLDELSLLHILSGNVVQQILLLTCFSNYVAQDIYPWHVKSPEIIEEVRYLERFQEKKIAQRKSPR